MVTFISYCFIIIGAFNWFSIGFLQYDFVAGVFGTQASFLSRLIYMLIGIAGCWIIVMTIKYRGKVDIFNRRFKKTVQKVDMLGDDNEQGEQVQSKN